RAVYDAFLVAHGASGSDEEFKHWCGPPLAQVVAGLALAHDIREEPSALLKEYWQLVERAYVERVSLAPGASELLEWLAAEGITSAVVTSAPRQLAVALLQARGVLWRFAAVIGGDDTERGKPHPD